MKEARNWERDRKEFGACLGGVKREKEENCTVAKSATVEGSVTAETTAPPRSRLSSGSSTTWSKLYDLFSHVAPVASVRICRDVTRRSSLGYAYVNFNSPIDGDPSNAKDALNFTHVNGKPIRIMFSHRDPSLRKSGYANLFIKNLDQAIDTKALFETFSAFGTVLSCKIAVDHNENSMGYGFVRTRFCMVGLSAAAAHVPVLPLKASSAGLFVEMTAAVNKLQPSQLAEEQHNATRLFKQLHEEIQTTLILTDLITETDVASAMEIVDRMILVARPIVTGLDNIVNAARGLEVEIKSLTEAVDDGEKVAAVENCFVELLQNDEKYKCVG
ncbi:hypothetical protein SASPL_143150 [Salvia splendens]|uniref:RRM domain-containing protein n=1 Tax=Salvia splendens TaxID=180675 RepID=A0A8X8ZAJ6_SALSN|nr:hypothetical protein SASPL_143150 [Salvia splendens]